MNHENFDPDTYQQLPDSDKLKLIEQIAKSLKEQIDEKDRGIEDLQGQIEDLEFEIEGLEFDLESLRDQQKPFRDERKRLRTALELKLPSPEQPPRRSPPPSIAGKGKTLGDIVSPIVPEEDWECLK